MPAVMAAGGTSSLVVLAVVGIGAILLAILFGQLARRVPKSDGGRARAHGDRAATRPARTRPKL